MSEEQIVQFLQDNVDYMINNDIVLWLFRTLGWGVTKMLSSLVGVGKELYDFTFGLVDVTSWSGLDTWINEFRPLITIIMTASLVVLGFMYMFGKNKKHNLMTSILMFAVVATSSTFLFSTFNNWTIVFKDAVVSDEGVADGTALIKSNLYDLLYIDEEIGLKNMSEENRPRYSTMTESEVDFIKITEVLDWDDVENPDTKDILKKKMLFRAGGASSLVDVSNGFAWTSIGNDLYFRYKFHFFTFFMDALAVLLIYFCLSYKNVRISYELLVGRVLVTLKSADISTQKKLVKIFESIKNQYFMLCFTAITIRSYFIFTDYIKELSGSHSTLRGLVSLFMAFCVVDGSNIMQQITGVDAGLSTMTGKIIAGSHMIQGAVGAVNQNRMLHAMKQNQSTAKKEAVDKAEKNAKENVEGSRIGVVQFGRRDSGKEMEHDLEKADTSSPAVGKETASEVERDMPDDGLDSMAGKDGNRESVINQEGNGETGGSQQMDHDIDTDKDDQSMYDAMSGNIPEQMEDDLNKNEEEKGYLEETQKKDDSLTESRRDKMSPEGSMFDKWERKQMGEASGAENRKEKKSEMQAEQMGIVKTSKGRSARVTEEKQGRDRYVGGEAGSRRKGKHKEE